MFGKLFGKKPEPKEAKPRKAKKTPKEIATAAGEPWFAIVDYQFDKENPVEGSFELDWNEFGIKKLREAGYQGKTDEEVVDNYFTDVCRNVVLQTYEAEIADPGKRVERVDLGNGKAEYK